MKNWKLNETEYGPLHRARVAAADGDSKTLYEIVKELEAYIEYMAKHLQDAELDQDEIAEENDNTWRLEK